MRRLRILALHSFRTSGKIFSEQMKLAGLDAKLADLIDLVYVNAPCPATGPLPPDVPPDLFPPPYFEWWNAKQDPSTGEWSYEGWEETISYLTTFCAVNGPFDGLWAFSQGTMVSSILLAMQQKGQVLQDHPLRFAVLFAGVRPRVPELAQLLTDQLDVPSLHVIGERDKIKQWSLQLAELFMKPLVLMHPRGHIIPALTDESIATLRSFLSARAAESSL
ncbi:hypothetical protein WJX81_000221 [Elliptochloris bilobata]|uniref:Serine hydrolase domain-containing protein n=1 Tax=Elliptochloris bilobata TaxID=381761 RepID=A0AAW1SD78_9CHLO